MPFKELRREVITLDKNLRKYNKTVALPLVNLSVLYKLAIADCVFFKDSVTVTVSIPVTGILSKWELYEVVPVKFCLNSQPCSLQPSDPKLIARQGRQVVEISHDSSSSAKCAAGLVDGRPKSELTKYCHYTCSPVDDLVVQQVHDNEIIAANVDVIEANCFSGTHTTKFSRVGAVRIFPKCNCNYMMNGYYQMHAPLFCDAAASADYFTHVVPSALANLSATVQWNDQVFHNIASLNLKIDDTFPVLDLSGIKPHHIPGPPVLGHLSFTNLSLVLIASVLAVVILSVVIFWWLASVQEHRLLPGSNSDLCHHFLGGKLACPPYVMATDATNVSASL